MDKIYIEKSDSQGRILEFLLSVECEFTPVLSERINVADYAKKMAARANNIFLVMGKCDVGHAAYYSNDLQKETAFLTSICVKQEFRRSGLAAILLEEVFHGAIRDGMQQLALEVDVGNRAAVRFYSKYGFSKCESNQMVYQLT